MHTEVISPMERFRRNNDYEVVFEAIDFQIALHRSVIYKTEENDPAAAEKSQTAISRLRSVQKLIDPSNPSTVEIALHLMAAYRAGIPEMPEAQDAAMAS